MLNVLCSMFYVSMLIVDGKMCHRHDPNLLKVAHTHVPFYIHLVKRTWSNQGPKKIKVDVFMYYLLYYIYYIHTYPMVRHKLQPYK